MMGKKMWLAAAVAAGLVFWPAHKISALSNTTIGGQAPLSQTGDAYTPDANHTTQFTPYLAVGMGAYYGPYAYVKAYAPANATTINFTVELAPCGTNLGDPKVKYTVYYIDKNGGKNGDFTLIGSSTSSSCSDSGSKDLRTVTINTHRSGVIVTQGANDEGWRTFAVQAHLLNDTTCGHPDNTKGKPDCTPTEQLFRIKVATGSYTGGGAKPGSYIGLAEPVPGTGCKLGIRYGENKCNVGSPTSYTGVYGRQLDPKLKLGPPTANNFDWSFQFAPDCTILAGKADDNDKTSLLLYDMDKTEYSQPNLKATLSYDVRSDPGFNWHVQNTLSGVYDKNTNPNGFQSGSGQYDEIDFTAHTTRRYRLAFYDVNQINTIQMYVPFDEFSARQSYTCTSFTCKATPVEGDTTGTQVQVTVTNTANYKWGRGFQVRERYKGKPVIVQKVKQNWPSGGFSLNFQPKESRISTKTKEPSPPFPHNTGYFVKPANEAVSFVLYDDTGSDAQEVNWDSGNCGTGSTPTITVNCNVTESDDVEPGQSDSTLYKVAITASGSGDGGDYKVVLTVHPGAYVTGPTTQTVTNLSPGAPYDTTVPFSGYLAYTGTFSAKVTDPTSGVTTCPGGSATPSTRPYFVYHMGDFFTGGGFYDTNGNCTQTTPYPSDADTSLGGIKAYATSGAGSHGDYAVDALGVIYGNLTDHYGFYSASGSGILFADKATGGATAPLGGYLNSNSQAHCVPDFYDNYKGATTPLNNRHINTLSSGRYTATGPLNINYATSNFKKQVTIFVDGDVTIKNDITYVGSFNPTDPSNIPFLAIVAKGNITLSGNVKNLDGLYIAQPDSGGNKGIFATCDNNEHGTSCARQLTVNGEVIAQKYDLLRGHGTVGPQDPGYTSKGFRVGSDPAEIFNYVPSMVLGTPNFSWPNSKLNGLYNLPPVF